MSCEACKESLLPENPTVPQWNPHTHEYLKPLCESCRSPFKETSLGGWGVRGEGRELKSRAFALEADIAELRTVIRGKKLIVKTLYYPPAKAKKETY